MPEHRRAAIYCRVSKDEDGRQTSTARQEADCRARCDADRLDVAAVHVDAGISGYRTVERPAYEALLAGLRNRDYDTVVVWKLDRLTRQGIVAVGRFLELLRQVDGRLISLHDPIDTSTAIGEGILGLLAAVARQESENTSLRIRSALDAAAKTGGPRRSGRRPFGHTRGCEQLVPHEATLIAEAARRVLAGESLRSICLDWNDQGHTTSQGNRWRTQSLRLVLLQPRLVGDREHNGTITAEACWPAILDRDQWARVRAVLLDPARVTPSGATTGLLTGVLRCGHCGHRMHLGRSTNRHTPRYQCPARPEGCNRITILTAPTDAFVTDTFWAALDTAHLRPADHVDTAPLLAELAGVEADLERAATDYYAERVIDRRQFLAASNALTERIGTLRSQLAEAERRRANATELRDPATLRAEWGTLPVGRRRARIEALFGPITVQPATPPTNRFDPARLVITPRR